MKVLLAGVVVLLSSCSLWTQAAPAPDRGVEDQVARAFVRDRAAKGLGPLQRIVDRSRLRQLVCVAASTGKPNAGMVAAESEADSTVFEVSSSKAWPASLRRVAEYNDAHTGGGRHVARFAVAAFRDPRNAEQVWVGVGLYWSGMTEFVALHLTSTYQPPSLSPAALGPCAAVR